MALRECPGCGKKVSDSVNSCIHCGYDFKKAAEELSKREQEAKPQNKYSSLSSDEKTKYEHEFYANHVGYKKAISQSNLSKSISVFQSFCYLPFVLLVAGIRIAKSLNWISSDTYMNQDLFLAALFVSIALLAVDIICAIVSRVLKNRSNRDLEKYGNEFIDWLRETKQIYF